VTATAFTDLTGSASVERSLFHGVTGATVTGGVNPILITETPGVLTVDDSTFVLQGSGGTPATGFTATQGATFFGPTSATVTARHVNLIGDGSANSVAAAVWATLSPLAGSVVSATFANSVLHGFQHRFSRTGSASSGIGSVDVPASISATYSDFDTSSDAADTGPGSTTLGAGNLTADPQLRDPSNGDYRLKGSSPLIDAGDPAVPGAGEPGIDEAGLARSFRGR